MEAKAEPNPAAASAVSRIKRRLFTLLLLLFIVYFLS
jgi:hypothetical protein